MVASSLTDLREVFSQMTDPRKARGACHSPGGGVATLVLRGLLSRITEMAVLERWATAHWDQLKELLGRGSMGQRKYMGAFDSPEATR